MLGLPKSFSPYNLISGTFLKKLFFEIKKVKSNEIHVTEFKLEQNFPNPFNPNTTIKYSIPVTNDSFNETTTLTVYDILGREVVTLVNTKQKAGSYEVVFNAHKLSSGTYFYRLKNGAFSKTMKFILLK